MASPINFHGTNWKRCVRSVREVSGMRPKQGSRTDRRTNHGRITDSFSPMIRTDRTDDFQSAPEKLQKQQKTYPWRFLFLCLWRSLTRCWRVSRSCAQSSRAEGICTPVNGRSALTVRALHVPSDLPKANGRPRLEYLSA